MSRLAGKVAIITGAASGQGAVEAKLFAKEGAQVVATDMQEELLQSVVNEIRTEFGDVAIAVKHNVAEESDWIQVVRQAVEKYGKIDILINNAGITGKILALADIDVEEWNKVMNVNALGNLLGIKHVVPEMRKTGQGSIVNISSLAGINGLGGIGAYGASKGATRTLTKGAARDLGPDHIRVNSVHPGFIQTPMISNYTENEEVKKQLISQIPLQYLGNPEDVAFAALFLASDESRFITGEELIIDGGQSIKE
ncbi:SDR family NAD(P)-dependent oxidoreductase [Cohnella thailandensis]|uniref:SDR family oxidoreductase n=1 Tax=Cohnella thailandensis TaxID=557557 RepID=A0A841T232_9BACL|nr:SDR family oxidoreductase [Cohnella thailandensis]MBB6638214.1 SDR family oxidoreductase [Cohnella thailandensis]MBP1977775.1 NAD(P)-dependent dehydrogenase (short-subunit alcohol dehydrogenase family) [Cohnella thailandensis]